MNKTLLIVFSIISTLSYSQNDKPLREPFSLNVNVDEENFYQQNLEATSYFVADKILQISPTEKILVEAEVELNTIKSLKTVKENLHPERTIEIKFEQTSNGKIHEQMILTIQNPFDKELKYNALIYILGHNDWIETSIIPIMPKLISYEMWPDVILSIVLKDWELNERK